MIKKIKGKYIVLSETGRRFGAYPSLAAAKRRLAQIEYFKRLKNSPRLRRKLRKKNLAT